MILSNFQMPKLIFADGALSRLGGEASFFGKKAVLCVSGSSVLSKKADAALASLMASGVSAGIFVCPSGEPDPETFDGCAGFIKGARAEMVVAMGGGSVIDIAKGAAALAVNEGGCEKYIEGVGGEHIKNRPLPFIALPTTSGTGSEMTKNSVIMRRGSYKNSMRDDLMLARTAIVDPALTVDLPKKPTVSSGADAVCQLIESYTTRHANAVTDGIAITYIKDAIDALIRVAADGSDKSARAVMSISASMSGVCLANSGLGLAHGIAAQLGAVCGVPHGIACGILMPHVAMFNAKKGVHKYADIAASLGKSCSNDTDAGRFVADTLFRMNEKIGVPENLKEFRIAASDLDRVIALTAGSSSAKKNPVDFSAEELGDILRPLI